MTDGPRKPGSLSTGERLRLLLDQRRRWRHLQFTKQMTVDMTPQCHAYELVGGTFAKVDGANILTLLQLPNPGQDTATVIRRLLDIPTKDFALDPTQDLLVLVKATQECVAPTPQSLSSVH